MIENFEKLKFIVFQFILSVTRFFCNLKELFFNFIDNNELCISEIIENSIEYFKKISLLIIRWIFFIAVLILIFGIIRLVWFLLPVIPIIFVLIIVLKYLIRRIYLIYLTIPIVMVGAKSYNKSVMTARNTINIILVGFVILVAQGYVDLKDLSFMPFKLQQEQSYTPKIGGTGEGIPSSLQQHEDMENVDYQKLTWGLCAFYMFFLGVIQIFNLYEDGLRHKRDGGSENYSHTIREEHKKQIPALMLIAKDFFLPIYICVLIVNNNYQDFLFVIMKFLENLFVSSKILYVGSPLEFLVSYSSAAAELLIKLIPENNIFKNVNEYYINYFDRLFDLSDPLIVYLNGHVYPYISEIFSKIIEINEDIIQKMG